MVGPCSIHNHDEALEYAQRLKAEADARRAELFIVMRAYFEKPRTTVGWKGYINDPHLDGSFAINEGLERALRPFVCLGPRFDRGYRMRPTIFTAQGQYCLTVPSQ